MELKVLTREELLDVYRKFDNPKKDRDSVIEAMGAAVDAAMVKLAEQEPVAWEFYDNGFWFLGSDDIKEHYQNTIEAGYPVRHLYARPMPCVSPTSDKTSCVSEKAESDTQTNYQEILNSSFTPNEAEEALRNGLDLVGLDMSAYDSPKEALSALIDWHISVAVDPRTNGGEQLVPIEPDQALLISMAYCLNHGFGLLTKEEQDSMLYDMRKLYNEVVGKGYYSPENRECYLAMLADEPKYKGESK